MPTNPMPSSPQSENMFGNNQDIDELIKNIDRQIAAIEEEERREKEKNKETQTSVEEKPIENINNNNIINNIKYLIFLIKSLQS